MDERAFDRAAGDTLQKLELTLAEVDEALDASLSMGVLTLEFDDGTKFVVNSHRAAGQIWMAAGASAWHFDLKDNQWIASKDGAELWALLAAKVGDKLGRALDLAAP